MSWAAATETFARVLDNYEPRAEQDRLANRISDALADNEHLLAEAGTGTGKSFAYLVPLAFRSKEAGKPSVVSTATKALQAQLADKDLPFLAKIFPWLRFAVVKGRGNYVCLDKLNSPRTAEKVAASTLSAVHAELEGDPAHSGDFEEFTTVDLTRDRQHLGVIADECPGKRDCPFGDVCYAERAKAAAADANVVVANHAVLMRDTEVKNVSGGKANLLPHYGALAIDEAHELEEYATSALGVEFGQAALERLADDVATFLRDANAALDLKHAARKLFDKVELLFGKGRDNTLRLDDERLATIIEELVAVLEATLALLGEVRRADVEGDDESMAKKRIVRRVEGMTRRLDRVIMAESSEIVRSVERETRTYRGQQQTVVKLAFHPLHVGEYLREQIWDYTPAVLVSATLSTGERGFGYIAERLGFKQFESFDAGSPFDYPTQSALYVPKPKVLGGTFPNEPKDDSWAARVAAETGELIRAAGGRALLLYTSRSAMESGYRALLPQLRAMGLTVLKQGDAPNAQLARTFKDDETSVLFALKSFMTGFDVQGDALRLVVLDKLPFPVPSDVIFQARAELIDATARAWKDKSFMALSVPMMILTLLQAFGRLIRTKQDQGMVAIFDPRLWSKGYGKGILNAMPDARRIDNFAAATAYLAELHDRRG